MVRVSLPEQTAAKLQQAAAKRGMDTSQLLVQLVEAYLAEQEIPQPLQEEAERVEQHQKIQREQQQYEAQHAALLALYKGQYVAMNEGKVVDHDLDRVALSRRIRSVYGKTAILITLVREEPRMTIHHFSPRLHKTQE